MNMFVIEDGCLCCLTDKALTDGVYPVVSVFFCIQSDLACF